MQPTHEDLRQAFQSGFDTIDDGDTFYLGFHACLEAKGYRHAEATPCTCSDKGQHGHQPECRWVKD